MTLRNQSQNLGGSQSRIGAASAPPWGHAGYRPFVLEDDMNEVWKDIEGFEGRYQVSDQGRVRSWKDNHGNRRKMPKIRKLVLWRNRKYFTVSLWKNGSAQPRSVHRLVLEAFRGLNPPGFEASHLNGNRYDNRLENLIWETRKDNHRRKISHGTFQQGERTNSAKLKEAQVKEIIKLIKRGIPQRRIAGMFGVSQCPISHIKLNKSWKHVSRR